MINLLITVKGAVDFPNCIIFISTLAIKLLEPTITDPTGAPRPFDRHIWFTNLTTEKKVKTLLCSVPPNQIIHLNVFRKS